MFLNQFSEQFVPILALVALRIVVGIGDFVLKRFNKPKKGAMQARSIYSGTRSHNHSVRVIDKARAVDMCCT